MVFLIGYGNPGRGDDGLGPLLAERLDTRGLPGVEIKIDFQLKVEHALAVARSEIVIFVDADLSGQGQYAFTEIPVGVSGNLDSHDVSPETVMTLASTLFGARSRGFVLAISGHETHDIKEGLSAAAQANLDLAEAFLLRWLTELPQTQRTSA